MCGLWGVFAYPFLPMSTLHIKDFDFLFQLILAVFSSEASHLLLRSRCDQVHQDSASSIQTAVVLCDEK